MSEWPIRQLGDVLHPRNDIVHPRDSPTGTATFVGLEHIQPQTGQRIGSMPIDLATMTGRKARFLPGDIVYGYLRPYLNKVWIAEYEGFCSVDQYVFVVDDAIADTAYVATYLRSPAYLAAAPIDETPGQLPRIRLGEVLATPIPLPPVDQQRRIAGRLGVQAAAHRSLVGSSEAASIALVRLEERLLATAAVRAGVHAALSIGELTTSRPSPSVRSDGEAFVTAVTSGCLTSVGWSDAGLKSARMRASDVDRGTLAANEVLVSRSNTEELVGRAALFPGSARPVVATDLVFRLAADRSRILPEYLAIQLRSMQLLGYWRDRSSGASSTMKKITRAQLNAALVPVPPLDMQHHVAWSLRAQLAEIDETRAALEAQRSAIDALPAAILREAFGSAASRLG